MSVELAATPTPGDATLVDVQGLKLYFPVKSNRGFGRKRLVRAVEDVTFTIRKGETLGLVGESGCGKTSLGRGILQLYRPTAGHVLFRGRDLTTLGARELREARREMQIVFQDPGTSLNPRMTAEELVAEPLLVHKLVRSKAERRERVGELLSAVGLDPSMGERYPHEFSGGQRQRVAIARALASSPALVVCDEPVSTLDASIQAQVVNLLVQLQEEQDLTYLFIGHDLAVVRHVAQRIAVMYLGRIVELADTDDLFANPLHPYTQALISAVPIPDPVEEAKGERLILAGDVPSPTAVPQGCVFHPRCPLAVEACAADVPTLRELRPGHWVACIRADEPRAA